MSIPHVDRSLAHVDRAVVPASPAVVYESIMDVAELLEDHRDVRVESWPGDGLRTPGASFWAVHRAVPDAGHAVSYEVEALETPNLLDLHATSDLYEASHRVLVAPASGTGTEVSWTVAIAPDHPTTHQLLEDAALLATIALQQLDTIAPTPAEGAPAQDSPAVTEEYRATL